MFWKVVMFGVVLNELEETYKYIKYTIHDGEDPLVREFLVCRHCRKRFNHRFLLHGKNSFIVEQHRHRVEIGPSIVLTIKDPKEEYPLDKKRAMSIVCGLRGGVPARVPPEGLPPEICDLILFILKIIEAE